MCILDVLWKKVAYLRSKQAPTWNYFPIITSRENKTKIVEKGSHSRHFFHNFGVLISQFWGFWRENAVSHESRPEKFF